MSSSFSNLTTICLIRHGETDWNASGRLQGREDVELNEAGREQALKLAGYFKQEKWDLVFSSPLKRALESARIIASGISASLVVNGELIERDYGQASGMLPEERRQRFPDGKFPGQEEFGDLAKRAMKALDGIVAGNTGKKIVVVTHGAFIYSVLYTLSNGEIVKADTWLNNACISKFQYFNNKWTIDFYNKTLNEV